MKTQISFSYVPRNSLIHQLDPRSKLIALIVLSLILFRISSLQGLVCPVLLFFLATFISGTSYRQYILSVKPLAMFLIAIFVFHILLSGQNPVNPHELGISQEKIAEGLLVVGRLILLILFASLFSSTTSPAMLVQGIESILQPFPVRYIGITASEIATMIALSINLVPMLLRYMGEIQAAQYSRGMGNRFTAAGIFSVALPFIYGCIRLADDISAGMESRCYTGGARTQLYETKYAKVDHALSAASVATLVVISIAGW